MKDKRIESIPISELDCKDELAVFSGRIVIVGSDELPSRTITGKVTALTDSFVTLERRDGRLLKIKRGSINSIEMTRVAV